MLLVSCRPVEAAAAVFDISPAQSTMDAGETLARLQGYDTFAIRRRFRELSVVVHPDKCMLPGARQVRISRQTIPHACCYTYAFQTSWDRLANVFGAMQSVRLTC